MKTKQQTKKTHDFAKPEDIAMQPPTRYLRPKFKSLKNHESSLRRFAALCEASR